MNERSFLSIRAGEENVGALPSAGTAWLRAGAGFEQGFVVSEEVYNGFIGAFKDRNPYHVSDEAARAKGFAGKIMHGNILNGFLSYFVGECLPVKTVVIQSQEIQFHKPVYLNDTVTLHVSVEEYYDSVKTVRMKFYFENQNQLKIAKGKLSVGLV